MIRRACPLAATMLLALFLAAASADGSPEQLPAMGDRDAAFVAASERLAFHSDFWFNLHDFLYWRTQRGGPVDEAAGCIASLESGQRQAWERAGAWYGEQMASRDPRTDDLMRSIRFDFTGLADAGDAVAAERETAYEVLTAAAPAYRACLWEAHDRRNREWIAGAIDLLERHESAAMSRLERLYREPWPTRVPVDLVGYSNWAGANTTGLPLHMLLSAVDEDNFGPGQLEILLHEGSHGVFGPRHGTVTAVLEAALQPHGLTAGRDVWHSVLFYTAGRVAEDLLRTAGVPDYRMYMVRVGVYDELFPLLAEHWEPYLAGEATMEQAAAALASALASDG